LSQTWTVAAIPISLLANRIRACATRPPSHRDTRHTVTLHVTLPLFVSGPQPASGIPVEAILRTPPADRHASHRASCPAPRAKAPIGQNYIRIVPARTPDARALVRWPQKRDERWVYSRCPLIRSVWEGHAPSPSVPPVVCNFRMIAATQRLAASSVQPKIARGAMDWRDPVFKALRKSSPACDRSFQQSVPSDPSTKGGEIICANQILKCVFTQPRSQVEVNN